MEKTSKRFEEWEEIDCNDCAHYWDSSCDGASKGSSVACNSFLATRSVVIPAKINKLEQFVKWLSIAIILCGVAITLHSLSHLLELC